MTKISMSMRHAFVAPQDYVWCSADFSSQEMRIAAALSRDEALLNIYFMERDSPYLTNPNTGEEYENPECDPHVMAARELYDYLKQVDIWDLIKASKSPNKDGLIPRQIGKILNFSLIYGATANKIAFNAKCSPKEAQKLIDRYFARHSNLKIFLDNASELSKSCKYITNCVGRPIFVFETNAKGLSDGNSAARKGGNALVQSAAAEMTKLALVGIDRDMTRLNDKRRSLNSSARVGRLGFPVHDECNAIIPGSCRMEVVPDSKREGHYIYKSLPLDLDIADECLAYEYQEIIVKHMEKAMTDILSPLIGKPFPPKATAAISKYWDH